MKQFIAITLLVITFGLLNNVQAQFRNPELAWGLSTGGAHGNSFGNDRWVMQYRGFLQYELIAPMLVGQLGLGYTPLYAPGVYSAETGIIDLRLLFSPFTLSDLNPYIYGGFGLSKCLNANGSDYLPMIPLGLGIQTRISREAILELTAGYNYSLSDELDGRSRSNANLNPVTNQKQDGFYGFAVGVAFPIGYSYSGVE